MTTEVVIEFLSHAELLALSKRIVVWMSFSTQSDPICSIEPAFQFCVSICCFDMMYYGSLMTYESISQKMLLPNAAYICNL